MLLVVAAVLGSVGFSSARDIQRDCDLTDLRPASIGANSFIYAADGSLLGSIPAEKNRQPVSLAQTSPWMAKATVAIEDRRFYQHGGIDFQGIARRAPSTTSRPVGRSRAARRSRSSSSATSTSATTTAR